MKSLTFVYVQRIFSGFHSIRIVCTEHIHIVFYWQQKKRGGGVVKFRVHSGAP